MEVSLLLIDIVSSSLRWMVGLFLGTATALILAFLYSFSPKKSLVSIPIDFMRAIPILAIVPLVLFFIGNGFFAKTLIITIATTFPIFISIVISLKSQGDNEIAYFENLNMNTFDTFKVMTLPRLVGGSLNGLTIASSIGWISVVAAELIGIKSNGLLPGGLGYRIDLFYQIGSVNGMISYVVVFGILGLLTSKVFSWLSNRYFNSY